MDPSLESSVTCLLMTAAMASCALAPSATPVSGSAKTLSADRDQRRLEMVLITADVNANHCKPYRKGSVAVECDLAPMWGGTQTIKNLVVDPQHHQIVNQTPLLYGGRERAAFTTPPELSFQKESAFHPHNWLVHHAWAFAHKTATGEFPAATFPLAVGQVHGTDWKSTKPSSSDPFDNKAFTVRIPHMGVNLKTAGIVQLLEERQVAAEKEQLEKALQSRMDLPLDEGFILGGFAVAQELATQAAVHHLPQSSTAATQAQAVQNAGGSTLAVLSRYALVPMMLYSLNPMKAQAFDVWKVTFDVNDDSTRKVSVSTRHLATYEDHELALRHVHTQVESVVAGLRRNLEILWTDHLLNFDPLKPLKDAENDFKMTPDHPDWLAGLAASKKMMVASRLLQSANRCVQFAAELQESIERLLVALEQLRAGSDVRPSMGLRQEVLDRLAVLARMGPDPYMRIHDMLQDSAQWLPQAFQSACDQRHIPRDSWNTFANQTLEPSREMVEVTLGRLAQSYARVAPESAVVKVVAVVARAVDEYVSTITEEKWRTAGRSLLNRITRWINNLD